MTFSTFTYVGVDGECFGEGQDDTQPLDTWLQNRLNENMKALALEPRSLCFSPVISSSNDHTTFAGIRPYASLLPHTTVTTFVQIVKGQTGLLVDLACHSDTVDATDAGQIEIRATLGDGTRVFADLTRTHLATVARVGVVQLNMVFERPSPGTVFTQLNIDVRSVQGLTLVATTIGPTADGVAARMRMELPNRMRELESVPPDAGPEYWVPNAVGAGQPTALSREMMYYRTISIGGGYTATGTVLPRKTLLAAEDGGGTNGTFALAASDVPYSPDLLDTTGAAEKLPCFFLRAIHVEPLFGRGSLGVRRAFLAPNEVLGSGESMTLVGHVEEVLSRPRQLLMGPKGIKHSDAPEYFSRGYAMHWPFVVGDSSTDKDTTLVNDSFFFTTEDPDLVLATWWIHVQHGATNVNLVDSQSFDFALGSGNKEKSLEESATLAFSHWDLTITVDQLDNVVAGQGSWATDSTNYGLLQPVEQFRMDAANVQAGEGWSPVAVGLDHQHQGSKGGGGLEAAFWFREGSLFPTRNDMRFMQHKEYTIPISGMDANAVLRPHRLKINATWDSGVGKTDYLNPGIAAPSASLRLVLAGFALFELPRNV